MTINELRDKLRNLPAGADGVYRLYDTIVSRIQKQEGSDSKLAFRALAWVVLSQRRLTSPELQHVLAWKHGRPDIDPDDQVSLEAIRDVCFGLLVFSQRRVNLVHNTAQSYFRERADDLFVGFHAEIAHVCAGYLTMQVLEVPLIIGRSDDLIELNIDPERDSDHQESDQTASDHVLTHHQKAFQISGSDSGSHTFQNSNIRRKLQYYPFACYAAQHLGYHLMKSREWHYKKTDDLVWSILTEKSKVAFFGRVIYHMEFLELSYDTRLLEYSSHGSFRPALEGQANRQSTEEPASSELRVERSEDMSGQRDSNDVQIDRFLEFVMELLGLDVESHRSENSEERDSRTDYSEDNEYWDDTYVSLSQRMDDYEDDLIRKRLSKTTPLHLAAHIGHVAVLDRLLEVHDGINECDYSGRTPIVIAMQSDNFEFVKACLERGALVSLSSTGGQEILLRMAKGNHDRILRAIISQNEDLLSTYDPGPAYGLSSIAKVPMILGYLALASLRYISPRINNIFSHPDGRNDIMAIYRQLNSDNILSAAARGDAKALRRMIFYNKAIFRLDDDDSRLGLLAAFVAVEYGKVDATLELLQGGIDVNIKNFEGDTLLHRSARRGHLSMAKVLVAQEADVTVQDRMGNTPWGAALRPENQEGKCSP